MNVPKNLKYTDDHEWIMVNGEIGTIGITDYAQKELGDIVYIDVQTVGESLSHGDTFGTVEAVKTVADMYMPVGGEVLEVNEKLADHPELVNSSAYTDGWIIKIKISNASELNDLLSPEDYKNKIQG